MTAQNAPVSPTLPALDGEESSSPSERARHRRALWFLIPALAVIELVGHFVIVSRVPALDDWKKAAVLVRAEWKDGDVITTAPAWADPLMRLVLGDLLDLEDAGRSDLAGYRNLWTLSIRGHLSPEAHEREPDLVRIFGRVTVIRQRLDEPTILYDFVEHVLGARVVNLERGAPVPCPRRRLPAGRPGGLSNGPMWPVDRFVCDPSRPWLFVGPTVVEDLDFQPRACVWNHPAGPKPVRTTFSGVPLGDRIVLYGGLYWGDERERRFGPVHVSIQIDGEEVGRMIHRDGDGWKHLEANVPEAKRGATGEVSFLVSAPRPEHRTFCWAASTRLAP